MTMNHILDTRKQKFLVRIANFQFSNEKNIENAASFLVDAKSTVT